MKTTTYLYDCKPKDFMYMPYDKAIKYKYKKANELHTKLEEELSTNYANGEPYKNLHELRTRCHYVYKAKMHNYELITEMEWENG